MVVWIETYSTSDSVHLANTFTWIEFHETMILGFVLNGGPYEIQQMSIFFTFP